MWRLFGSSLFSNVPFMESKNINGLIFMFITYCNIYLFIYLFWRPRTCLKIPGKINKYDCNVKIVKHNTDYTRMMMHHLIVTRLFRRGFVCRKANSKARCCLSYKMTANRPSCHYENTPIQIYWKFQYQNFQKKNLIFFIFLLKT